MLQDIIIIKNKGQIQHQLGQDIRQYTENIKTIERLSQVKISDLSIILYLHHCSEGIIRHYSNVKS